MGKPTNIKKEFKDSGRDFYFDLEIASDTSQKLIYQLGAIAALHALSVRYHERFLAQDIDADASAIIINEIVTVISQVNEFPLEKVQKKIAAIELPHDHD